MNAIGLVELHHSPKIAAREPAGVGLLLMDESRQLLDRSFSPTLVSNPPCNELSDRPIKIDERRVDGTEGAPAGRIDHYEYLIEVFPD